MAAKKTTAASVTTETATQTWYQGQANSALPANTFTDPQGEALTYRRPL
jgi:hypothetical protein